MTSEIEEQSALVVASDGAEREAIVRELSAMRSRGKSMLTSVTQASDPYDAIRLFHRSPASLVVFSLEGCQRRDAACLRQMRRVSPGVRVLLVASQGLRRHVPTFLNAGGDSVIFSPFYTDEIRLLSRSLLRSDAADPLTGIPNRAAGNAALAREMSHAGVEGDKRNRPRTTLGFGLLDLDHFKRFNTEYGYAEADRVLRKVARTIRDGFRITDVVFRWGGEEIVVLLTGLPPDEEAARRGACEKLNRVRRAVADLSIRLWDKNRKRCMEHVTLSGGLSLHPFDSSNESAGVGEGALRHGQ